MLRRKQIISHFGAFRLFGGGFTFLNWSPFIYLDLLSFCLKAGWLSLFFLDTPSIVIFIVIIHCNGSYGSAVW